MLFKKQLLVLCFLSFSYTFCNAQIEGAELFTKGYHAFGFGSFLNFAIPVSEANYVTLEAGFQDFKDKDDYQTVLVPFLAGYRYTLNQTGMGFYVEPNAGYVIGANDDNANVGGIAAGVSFGYLVDLGNIPFSFSFRYERTFGTPGLNVASLRIAHSFSFRKRDRD